MYTDDKEYQKALKRVKKKKEFYQHLSSYIIIGGFFLVINLLTSPGVWWFYWPMLGWGVGLAFHYVSVFGLPGIKVHSSEWEEKELQKELEKYRRNQLPAGKMTDENSKESKEELELKELRKNWDERDLV